MSRDKDIDFADLADLAFVVLRKNYHRPFVNGKCNRKKIQKNLTHLDQFDVDYVCDIVDDMIMMFNRCALSSVG